MQDNLVPFVSTSRHAGGIAGLWLAVLALFMIPPAVAAQASRLEMAIEHYDAAEYSRAADLLEQVVAETPSAEAYHWLGRTYGHMAEQAALFRALELARMTRAALEKAVELDADNRPAVEDLMEYYRQAPAIVGGSQKQAARLERRLTAMDRSSRVENDYQSTANSGS